MNFTFSDASRSFLNLVQQDLPRQVGLKTAKDSPNESFAEKLSKSLETAGQRENGVDSQTDPARVPENSGSVPVQAIESSFKVPAQAAERPGKTMDSLIEKLNGKKGISFVSALKSIFLMLSKGELKNISIDNDGLESLKKMLLNAGFTESDIDDLIAELIEEFDGTDLTLDLLFDRLTDLSHEVDAEIKAVLETEAEPEIFFETPAIPFLDSILASLGIPAEKIQEISAQADKGDKGISLDVVIEKLQVLQKQSFYSRDDYKTQKGDDNFRFIARQLGLELKGSQSSGLTLDELVSSFEAYRTRTSKPQIALEPFQQKTSSPQIAFEPFQLKTSSPQIAPEPFQLKASSPQVAFEPFRLKASNSQTTTEVQGINDQTTAKEGKLINHLTDLFKGLELKNKTAETKVFKFSYEQIKDQFENKLVLSDKEKAFKTDPSELVSKQAANSKMEETFKTIESLLPGEKDGVSDGKDPKKEGSEFFRQLKSHGPKLSDQSQVSILDAKTNEAPSHQGSLKAGASFKNLPAFVTHQVSRSLSRAISQGDNTLTIQLKPAALGRIVMTIDNSGSSMKVSILTENYAAKDILTSNANEIRSVLSASGVTLERFEVDMSSQFRQSMADARSQADNFDKRHRNRGNTSFDAVNNEIMNETADLPYARNISGSLHFVA